MPSNVQFDNPWCLLHQQPDPHKIVYQVESCSYTVDDLIQNSKKFAHQLQIMGIVPRTKTLLIANDSIEWIYCFWALSFLGAEIFVLSPRTDQHSVVEFCATHDVQKIITDNQPLLSLAHCVDLQQLNCNQLCNDQYFVYDSQDVLINFSTSGTSGNLPNVVPHTVHNLLQVRHSIKNLFDLCGIDSTSRLLCSAKFSFVWGFCAQLLGPLLYGTTNLIVTSALNYKDLGLECEQHRITNLIVNPYLLKLFNSTTQVVPTVLKSVCVGGEMLSINIAKDFVHKFDLPLINCYGLTETLFTIVGGVFDAARPNSIGRAFETVQIKVLDDHNQPVPAGTPGRLAVKTLHQASAYCHNCLDSDQVFVDSWIHTSDLVCVDQDQHVIFLGRLNSCVKIKGDWHSLSLVEDIIQKLPRVDDCVVFQSANADGTTELSSIVCTPDQTMTSQHVQWFLKSQNQKKFLIPTNIKFVQELPRTVNMKKIRSHAVLKNLLLLENNHVGQQ